MPINTRFYKKNRNGNVNQNSENHDKYIGRSSRGGGYFGDSERGPRIHDDVKLFHGPIRFKLFGMQIHISTARQIGFVAVFVAFVVMLFSMYATFAGLNYNKEQIANYESKIETINEKDKVYKELIENAKADVEDEYFLGDGYFFSTTEHDTKYHIYSSCGAYYVTYYIEKDEQKYQFSTPVIYASIAEIEHLSTDELGPVKRSFKVAYKVDENGEIVDSIVADYTGDVNYEKNYYLAKIEELRPMVKVSKVSAGIMIAITAGVLVGIIALIVKTIKKSKALDIIEKAKREAELISAKTEVAIAEEKFKMAQEEISRKYRYCQYCGAKFSENDEKCSNCGSTHYYIKRK